MENISNGTPFSKFLMFWISWKISVYSVHSWAAFGAVAEGTLVHPEKKKTYYKILYKSQRKEKNKQNPIVTLTIRN